MIRLWLALIVFMMQAAHAIAGEATGYFPKGAFLQDEASLQSEFLKPGLKHSKNLDRMKRFKEFNTWQDEHKRNWYSKQLVALQEPILFQDRAGPPTYRLTWLRTFHHPMTFRWLPNSDGTSTLITKSSDGSGGFEPGKLFLAKEVTLDNDKTDQLRRGLNSLNIISLPTSKFEMGLDGASWIFEVREQGKYHVVDRWGGGELRAWALTLMRASTVELGEVY